MSFHNIGGYHNINGTQSSNPNNPGSFGYSMSNWSSSVGNPTSFWVYSYIFTTAGSYTYKCDPHVSLGMIGSIEVLNNLDCNGIRNGTSVKDDCGICRQAYVYDFFLHIATFIDDTNSLTLGPTEILVLPGDPGDPYWNSSCLDCNGIVNGLGIIDDCGVCQPAVIYNYVTNVATPILDTLGYVFGPTEQLVYPNSSYNSNWNSSCSDCNGVVNGTSIFDDCGVCQSAYVYNTINHNVYFLDDTNGIVLDPSEVLIMPTDSSHIYWNSSCGFVDCNGINNGTSLVDDCGQCQLAYIYNYMSHNVTFVNDTNNISLDTAEILVMPNDSLNMYWNSNCRDCNGIINGLAMIDDCGVCQSALVYNTIFHSAYFVIDTNGIVLDPTEILLLANSANNPNWNSSCTIDCNGVANGTSIVDSCGTCHQAFIYNISNHSITYLNDTNNIVLSWNELLYLAGPNISPNWNANCNTDCNGIVNGLAMVDDCGVCQSALVYNYGTHVATPIADTTGYVFGPTELLVQANSSSNSNWNSSCSGCTDSTAFNYDPLATVDDGSCVAIAVSYTHLTLPTNREV